MQMKMMKLGMMKLRIPHLVHYTSPTIIIHVMIYEKLINLFYLYFDV